MAKTDTLVDTFATKDAVKWTFTGTADVAAGQATSIPTSGYANKVMSAATYDLTSSSFSAELFPAPAGNGTIGTFFEIYESVSTDVAGFIVEGGVLYYREKIAGVTSNTSDTYNATTHRWLRLTHDGTNLLWETSPDRSTWTTRRTKVPGRTWTSGIVQFLSGFYGTEPTPGTAAIDNINASPGVAADVAAATGAAGTSTVAVGAAATSADGAGSASAAAAAVAAQAGVPAGGGSAEAPSAVAGVAADVAAATGVGHAASADVTVNADAATGTGTAFAATASVGPAADVAAGTGTANAPSTAVQTNAGAATGTGSAGNARVGRVYYIDPAGSDAANGQSAATAWATVAQLNLTVLGAGDRVLFKRGGTWTGTRMLLSDSGQSDAPVTISAYGSGALPIIDGGGTNSTRGTVNPIAIYASWVTVEYVQVQHAFEFGLEVGDYATDIELRNFVARNNPIGVKVYEGSQRTLIHDFQAVDNNIIIVRPGPDDDYAAMGLDLGGNLIEVYNFEISGSLSLTSPDYGSDGSAIEIYGATNTLIRDGIAYECETFAEFGNTATANVTFRNIVYWSTFVDGYAVVVQGSGTDFGPVTGITFEHCSFRVSGASSFGIIVGPDAECDFRNNIVQANYLGWMPTPQDESHNVWFGGAGGHDLQSIHHATQTGIAPTSTIADPLWINPAAGNLRLGNGSPAIDRGVAVAWTTDLDGNPRTVGAAPDSGAYEWQGPLADAASGTGTAPDATGSVGANAATATAAGTANDPAVAVTATAGHAAGSGTAYDAAVSTAAAVNADPATATGSAQAATAAVDAAATAATGSGAANDATATVTATADVATGAGSASDPAATITSQAGVAIGSGQAHDVTVTTTASPAADPAEATGQADQATANVGPNSAAAAGTGTAHDATTSITTDAGTAAGAGAAFDATVNTSASTNAAADVAAATGAAFDAAAAVTTAADIAVGTGSADSSTAAVEPSASAATSVGTAHDTGVAVGVGAAAADASGTAFDATVSTSSSVNAAADTATGVGEAHGGSVDVAAVAGTAAASGMAGDATVAVAPPAQSAAASGTAYDGTVDVTAVAGFAEGSGVADDAGVATTSSGTADADLAAATGTAFDAAVSVAVAAAAASGVGVGWDGASLVRPNAAVAAAAGSAYAATVAGPPPPVVVVVIVPGRNRAGARTGRSRAAGRSARNRAGHR